MRKKDPRDRRDNRISLLERPWVQVATGYYNPCKMLLAASLGFIPDYEKVLLICAKSCFCSSEPHVAWGQTCFSRSALGRLTAWKRGWRNAKNKLCLLLSPAYPLSSPGYLYSLPPNPTLLFISTHLPCCYLTSQYEKTCLQAGQISFGVS